MWVTVLLMAIDLSAICSQLAALLERSSPAPLSATHGVGSREGCLFVCSPALFHFLFLLIALVTVLENRRITVSLLILFSSGCIHYSDKEGRHVHMPLRSTAQASLAIATLSQSPPCCFSLMANNIPMNFRELAQSFRLLCRYSSPLPVWCFKYQWLHFAPAGVKTPTRDHRICMHHNQ